MTKSTTQPESPRSTEIYCSGDCGHVFLEGEPLNCVSIHKEICENRMVIVISAESTACFCDDCNGKYDLSDMVIPLLKEGDVCRIQKEAASYRPKVSISETLTDFSCGDCAQSIKENEVMLGLPECREHYE